jgi:hypothetical protein
MKKLFDDDWSDDLSEFKVISIEDLNKGFVGNNSAFGNTINSPDYRSPFHDYRNTPLGYSYLTDNPVSVFASTGINDKGEKGYEYQAQVLPCENGSQVLGSYNANKREPQSLFLFYEKPNSKKSNFAGDFYIAKMGDYFVQLFRRFPDPLPSTVGGKFFKNITSLEDEAAFLAQLAYTHEGDKINATLARDALMREYQFYTGDRRFEEIIGNITSIPADAIGWCADQLESLKPTEKNYNPESKDYTPLIPLVVGVGVIPIPINMNKASQFFENLGNNPFVQGAEVAFTQVWELVKHAASKVKDASIEHLPDAFKGLVDKISNVIDTIKNFLSEVGDDLTELAKQGIEVLKVANAFYCGINSGLVGLLQCILYILQFLFQPTTALSYDQYKDRRDLLEKAEDVLDWILANSPVFLKGVKDLFSSGGGISQSDFEGIFDKMKEYWDKASRYTIAFYVGIVFFEFIINILLFIFTEGAGNVIKGTTYLQKATSLLKVITREAISAVTFGITDLLALLSRFIVRFGKACVKGFKGFIKFIEELLQGAKNGAKAEDLAMTAEEIEEVVLKGKKAQSIFNILAGARTGFKKLGIEIVAKVDGYLLKWKEKPIFKGDFKEVNTFWNKILKPKLGTGTGGAFKYLSEISSSKIFCQEEPMSCAAACIRQLAKDNGIDVPENLVRELAKTDWDTGTQLDNIKGAMTGVFKDMEVQVGTPYIGTTDMKQTAEVISQVTKKPWIATIRPPGGTRHTIIVDKIEDGIVYIRDPWDKVKGFGQKNGVEATMTIDDFEYFWKQCRYHHARVIIKQ